MYNEAADGGTDIFGDRGTAEGLAGISEEGLRDLIPSDFVPEGLSHGTGEVGDILVSPSDPGTRVRIMQGNPNAADPLHQGPRATISTGRGEGFRVQIPLRGNPVLEGNR